MVFDDGLVGKKFTSKKYGRIEAWTKTVDRVVWIGEGNDAGYYEPVAYVIPVEQLEGREDLKYKVADIVIKHWYPGD